MHQRNAVLLRVSCLAMLIVCLVGPVRVWSEITERGMIETGASWWFWPLVLFCVCVLLGMASVLGGVGGGVLYVTLVSAFFPFHIDFVRTAGLFVALTGALISGPGLLHRGLAGLRLALPPALIASVGSVLGAFLGLRMPVSVVQSGLGGTVFLLVVLLLVVKHEERPLVKIGDRIGSVLGMCGTCREGAAMERVAWQTHRSLTGLILFFPAGLIAGMFGLETGWANISIFNLVMGVPFNIAVGTGKFLLSFSHASAAWIYVNQGAVLPLIIAPSVVGMVIGSFAGVRMLSVTNGKTFRRAVLILLLVGGMKVFLKGLGVGE